MAAVIVVAITVVGIELSALARVAEAAVVSVSAVGVAVSAVGVAVSALA